MPDSSSAPQEAGAERRDEISAWLEFAQQLTRIGATAMQLLHAEVRLALISARRLFIICALMLPVILLAWIAFTALLSWGGYQLTVSYLELPALALGVGILIFLLQQLLAAYLMVRISREYRQNLRLPVTRHHAQQFAEVLRSGIRPVE